MATEKQMTLMMKIAAKGESFMKEMDAAEKKLAKFQGGLKSVNVAAGSVFSGLGSVLDFGLITPLKVATTITAGLGTAMAALGAKTLFAAAGDEKLVSRLTAVTGSVEKAKAIFASLENLSMEGPFDSEALTKAFIDLYQNSLASKENLGALASAARISGQNIDALTSSVIGLQARGLKRLGIDMEAKDGAYILSWYDKLGQKKKMLAKTDEDARKALLGVLGSKFGTGFGGSGLIDQWYQLMNVLSKGIGEFGEGLLKPAEEVVSLLIGNLKSFIASGDLQKWGQQVGDSLLGIIDKVHAAILTAKDLFANAKKFGEDFRKGLGDAASTLFTEGAKALAVGFLELIAASGMIWLGIGKLLAAGLAELLFTYLPGMGGTRMRLAKAQIAGLENEGNVQDTLNKILPELAGQWKYTPKSVNESASFGPLLDLLEANPALAARLAARGAAGNMLESALSDFKEAGKIIGTEIGAKFSAAGTKASDRLKGATGFDVGKTYEQHLAEIRGDRTPFFNAQMGLETAVPGAGMFGEQNWIPAVGRTNESKHIFIGNVEVYANSAGDFTTSMLDVSMKMGRPLVLAAG